MRQIIHKIFVRLAAVAVAAALPVAAFYTAQINLIRCLPVHKAS